MSNKKGFTLIELLIVIVIIGILSVAVAPKLLNYPKQARDSQRQQTVGAFNNAMQAYIGSTEGKIPASGDKGCVSAFAELAPYIDITAKDPKSPGAQKINNTSNCDYYYIIDHSGTPDTITAYAFVAKVEVPVSSGNYVGADGTASTAATLIAPATPASNTTYYVVGNKM
ncbi:MAG: prepilin-type N-terminal cleavage/methylation domain-containing protein [Candidatus Gracilibacteria bacterium]